MKNKFNSHLLSVDLESWIFSRKIDKLNLSNKQLRTLDAGYSKYALTHILKLLKKYDQKITFFIVGKLEEIYPGIIETILKDGHEIGWHTHTHANVENSTILRKELDLSSKIIKRYKIKGFQAPTITFFKEGYKILREYGFEYSSSIYGNSNIVYKIDGVYEIPVSVSRDSYKPRLKNIIYPSNMTIRNVRKFGIPFGSSFFWGILGKNYYCNKMNQSIKSRSIINTFIHDWQIVSPNSKEYKKDVSLTWNPLFLPYKINVASVFEHFISHHTFYRFIDYVRMKK